MQEQSRTQGLIAEREALEQQRTEVQSNIRDIQQTKQALSELPTPRPALQAELDRQISDLRNLNGDLTKRIDELKQQLNELK